MIVYRRHQAQDRKAAIEYYGNECVKCGFNMLIEVHHVNGTGDREINNLQPLCKWCHLLAPMGEEYWDWLAEGESGTDDLFRKVGLLFMDLSDEDSLKLVNALRGMATDGRRIHKRVPA